MGISRGPPALQLHGDLTADIHCLAIPTFMSFCYCHLTQHPSKVQISPPHQPNEVWLNKWANDLSWTSISHQFPKASQVIPLLAWLVSKLSIQSSDMVTANPRTGQDIGNRVVRWTKHALGGHDKASMLEKLWAHKVGNGLSQADPCLHLLQA